jgi:hypothetical protein
MWKSLQRAYVLYRGDRIPPMIRRMSTELPRDNTTTSFLPNGALRYDGGDVPPALKQTRKSNCTNTVIAMIVLQIKPDLNDQKWFQDYLDSGACIRFSHSDGPERSTAIGEFNYSARYARANLDWKLYAEEIEHSKIPESVTEKGVYVVLRLSSMFGSHVVLVHTVDLNHVIVRDPVSPYPGVYKIPLEVLVEDAWKVTLVPNISK